MIATPADPALMPREKIDVRWRGLPQPASAWKSVGLYRMSLRGSETSLVR